MDLIESSSQDPAARVLFDDLQWLHDMGMVGCLFTRSIERIGIID
jgi:hypothetical protein